MATLKEIADLTKTSITTVSRVLNYDKTLSVSDENRKKIIEVTASIADEKKYQVVLTRDSVVIVQKEMDITKEVLSRLNKKISKIKLDSAG